MLRVKNNMIELTRGDSAYLDIVIKNPTNPNQIYNLRNGDTLVFELKRTVTSPVVILSKEFEDNVLNIEPTDTVGLEIGDYSYKVILYFSNGEPNTVIEPSVFRISP